MDASRQRSEREEPEEMDLIGIRPMGYDFTHYRIFCGAAVIQSVSPGLAYLIVRLLLTLREDCTLGMDWFTQSLYADLERGWTTAHSH